MKQIIIVFNGPIIRAISSKSAKSITKSTFINKLPKLKFEVNFLKPMKIYKYLWIVTFILILRLAIYWILGIQTSFLTILCQYIHDDGVTRIIHQSWKTRDIPHDFQRYLPSWKKCFPHWTHRFWTDQDNRNLVKEHFPWFLEIYDSFPEEIYRADVSRYFYLYLYGGIYTDMDNECLAPFEHLLKNYTFVFGTIDNVDRKTPLPENYVQNSFMYSTPRQLFWLDLIINITLEKNYGKPDTVTGPEALCNMIHTYRNRYPYNHGVKIYEAKYFNPLSWGGQIKYLHCKPLSVMNDEEWKECRRMFIEKGSYVIQYHAHIWE